MCLTWETPRPFFFVCFEFLVSRCYLLARLATVRKVLKYSVLRGWWLVTQLVSLALAPRNRLGLHRSEALYLWCGRAGGRETWERINDRPDCAASLLQIDVTRLWLAVSSTTRPVAFRKMGSDIFRCVIFATEVFYPPVIGRLGWLPSENIISRVFCVVFRLGGTHVSDNGMLHQCGAVVQHRLHVFENGAQYY